MGVSMAADEIINSNDIKESPLNKALYNHFEKWRPELINQDNKIELSNKLNNSIKGVMYLTRPVRDLRLKNK